MSEPSRRTASGRRRRASLAVAAALITAALALIWNRSSGPDVTLLQQGRKELILGDSARALELAERFLAAEPYHIAGLLLAGDACFEREDYDRAMLYYRQVAEADVPESTAARFRCGRIAFHHAGNAPVAEEYFRAALEAAPDHRTGLFQLVSLLGIQARSREATPFILKLFQQGVFYPEFLDLLETPDSALFNLSELQRYQQVTPDDPGVLTGLAWHAESAGNTDQAIALLNRALESERQLAEPRITLALLLWKEQQYAALEELLAQDSVSPIDDSRLWTVRGFLAAHNGQSRAAARSFWEAWQRDPTSHTATYQLYRFLQDECQQQADQMQNHLHRLQQLQSRSDLVRSTDHATSMPVRQLVDALESVGRLWEAWGWCVVARDRYSDAVWAESRLNALGDRLEGAPLKVVCDPALPLELDLSQLPVPVWLPPPADQATEDSDEISVVSFRDDASAAGIAFQYFNSPSPPDAGQHLYEFNGGGAAVLDYDRDRWPDLYFTQGCTWEERRQSATHTDRLYRQVNGDTYIDVTASAGIFEGGFSTGMTAGDIDNDGFPDLYVANIGRNQLLRNNGDGTFDAIPDTAATELSRWSTSCVIADLNGDALPDIYSVNYLTGDDVFTRLCQHDDGRPRMCMPFHFPGEQDQLYLNRGNGSFQNVTAASGILTADGKGLGVVAGDWHGNGRLSLFVANDTVGNSFFINEGTDARGIPQFAERGLMAGVAVNRDGRAEGCMGVAAGDADGNGTLDLFVTNFLRETNTLYLSDALAVFSDATHNAGLAEPGRDLLGFGTQFLDADLDGHPDLLVANGHIDDYRAYGRPYQMPAQFFANDGTGQFNERPSDQLGKYFQRQVLGRGLSRLDWNRDGREDAVISHLDCPIALLTNTTPTANHWVAFRLSGVVSSRDAIGTVITLQTGRRTIVRQLTAGDGYQASNERVLHFGLGSADTLPSVIVRWPSGIQESLTQLEVNRIHVVVEGSGMSIEEAVPVPAR